MKSKSTLGFKSVSDKKTIIKINFDKKDKF